MHDPSEDPQPPQPVVLVVDDEDFICQLIRATLEPVGYFVLTANNGEQALKQSRDFPGRIHVLISDIVMPKMNGFVLREQILRERPAIQVLLMSGQTDGPLEGLAFLPKPFKLDEIKKRVGQLLGRHTGDQHAIATGTSRDNAMIENRLWNDLTQTIVEFRRAQSLETTIIKDTPSWLPAPDGVARIQQAGKVTKAAFEQYLRALERYRNFKDQGIVPQDLSGE